MYFIECLYSKSTATSNTAEYWSFSSSDHMADWELQLPAPQHHKSIKPHIACSGKEKKSK